MYTYIVGKKRRKAEIVEGENTIVIPSCWNKIWFIESENNIVTPRMNQYWDYRGEVENGLFFSRREIVRLSVIALMSYL